VSEAAVEIVRRQYASFNAGDWDGALENVDPAMELVAAPQSPLAGVYRGPEGVRAFLARVFEVYDQSQIRREPERLDVLGDRVLAIVKVHARFQGSELELDERWADLWTVRGGRIVRLEVFTDPAEGLRAVGG
jgi:ketosteroid isomerase-like protein